MFASSIPEIIELVGSGSKYGGELKREHGKRLATKKYSTKKNVTKKIYIRKQLQTGFFGSYF